MINDAAEMIADAGDPRSAIAFVAREAERRAGNFEEWASDVARGPHAATLAEFFRAQMKLQMRPGLFKSTSTVQQSVCVTPPS